MKKETKPFRFGHLNFPILNLFRISSLVLRIFCSIVAHSGAPVAQSGYFVANFGESLAQIGAFWAHFGTRKTPLNPIYGLKTKKLAIFRFFSKNFCEGRHKILQNRPDSTQLKTTLDFPR